MSPLRVESVISCADGQSVQPWQAEPYKLWSLLEMIQFFASDFFLNTGILPQVWARLHSGIPLNGESQKACFEAVKYLIKECERLKLPVSLRAGLTIQERITSGQLSSYEELGRLVTDLYSRVVDELSGPHFLMLNLEEKAAYTEPLREWSVQLKAFPSVQDDISEAMKCFALDRSTATVFHLMRALEPTLKA
jgi:hypothetical protein